MPTRRALLILAAAATCFMLAGLNPVAVYVGLTFNVTVITLLVLDRSRLPRADDVRIERRHRRVFSLAQPNQVQIEIDNGSAHPLRGVLQDNVVRHGQPDLGVPPDSFRCDDERLAVAVPPRSRVEFQYSLTPFERGRFAFGSGVLRARGPLGLAMRDYRFSDQPVAESDSGGAQGAALRRRARQEGGFTVYPSVISSTPLEVAALAGHVETGYHRLRRQVEGTAPSQIREYVPGDSYRSIHWKSTARHDRPMVMEFDTDRNQSIYIFVDCGRLMRVPVRRLSKLDYAINACAELARVAVDRGDSVGVCCFSDRVKVWHDAEGKRESLLGVLDSLALVTADTRATNYHEPINMFLARVKRRSLCVFLTTFSESESTWDLMRRLVSLRPTHVPAVVSVTDPALEAALRQEPESFEDACRKLAAADLREEVALFAEKLRQRQGYFLEVEADALSPAAVQTYLDAKSRGLL